MSTWTYKATSPGLPVKKINKKIYRLLYSLIKRAKYTGMKIRRLSMPVLDVNSQESKFKCSGRTSWIDSRFTGTPTTEWKETPFVS
jgi:hypothetical protein